MSDAAVWISPARCCGDPCVYGTRIPAYMVADMVWFHGVEEAQTTWELSRKQVLGVCWYMGAYGIASLFRERGPEGYRSRFSTPWRRRWRAWAESVSDDLWHANTVDYDEIPGPPIEAMSASSGQVRT